MALQDLVLNETSHTLNNKLHKAAVIGGKKPQAPFIDGEQTALQSEPRECGSWEGLSEELKQM